MGRLCGSYPQRCTWLTHRERDTIEYGKALNRIGLPARTRRIHIFFKYLERLHTCIDKGSTIQFTSKQ
eukprot:4140925-Pyramimonas_sp.AAC.1